MRSPRGILCAVGLVLFWALLMACSSRTLAAAPFREDPEKVIGFAHGLLAEGDAYRAVSEYQAFLFLFPQHSRVGEAWFSMGKAYQAEGQWDEALRCFSHAIQTQTGESPWAQQAALETGETLMKAARPVAAARALEEIARAPEWGAIRGAALYRAAWGWMHARAWGEAVRVLRTIAPEDDLQGRSEALLHQILDQVPRLPQRSAWVAGGLAALLPGSGHLYIGKHSDALTSFLLNGAFILGAVWAIREGYPITGGILSFFELGWYLGGISTASSGADQFNQAEEARWLRTIGERWGTSIQREARQDDGVILWAWRF
jgi:tetratricopeptide (TPR) repeat protein